MKKQHISLGIGSLIITSTMLLTGCGDNIQGLPLSDEDVFGNIEDDFDNKTKESSEETKEVKEDQEVVQNDTNNDSKPTQVVDNHIVVKNGDGSEIGFLSQSDNVDIQLMPYDNTLGLSNISIYASVMAQRDMVTPIVVSPLSYNVATTTTGTGATTSPKIQQSTTSNTIQTTQKPSQSSQSSTIAPMVVKPTIKVETITPTIKPSSTSVPTPTPVVEPKKDEIKESEEVVDTPTIMLYAPVPTPTPTPEPWSPKVEPIQPLLYGPMPTPTPTPDPSMPISLYAVTPVPINPVLYGAMPSPSPEEPSPTPIVLYGVAQPTVEVVPVVLYAPNSDSSGEIISGEQSVMIYASKPNNP